ncbi:MAG TPA: GvpL/GvpF family gas vesicle protein [Jatrophihabitans sp.]|jgi:hypothetical protein
MTAVADTTDHAVYVFGVVASSLLDSDDVQLPDDVDVVRAGPVAAVVGVVGTERKLGLAADVRRHDRVIAHFVENGITILPMRFGAVVTGSQTLVRDVLEPNGRAFADALRDLDGYVQYTVRVAYVRDAVLAAVMRADPRLAALRDSARAAGPARDAQVRLGEAVVAAINARRGNDANRIETELGPLADRLDCELSSDPDRLADFTCLVDRADADGFEAALEQIAKRHADAAQLTLLGPLAPYHFVPEL